MLGIDVRFLWLIVLVSSCSLIANSDGLQSGKLEQDSEPNRKEDVFDYSNPLIDAEVLPGKGTSGVGSGGSNAQTPKSGNGDPGEDAASQLGGNGSTTDGSITDNTDDSTIADIAIDPSIISDSATETDAGSNNSSAGGEGTSGTDGSGGTGGTDASGGTGGSSSPALPGDVLNDAGLTVVAAYSTVRVVVSGYGGSLYQVCKGSWVAGPNSCTGTPLDIGVVEGGYADDAAQNAFCSGGDCTITMIYDQSGHDNFLEPSPVGQQQPDGCSPVNAADLPVTINSHAAFGILIVPDTGYRSGCTDCTNTTGNETAVGDEPQTVYMVTSQLDIVDGCCFSFGNAERSSTDLGSGYVEAVYFGYGVLVAGSTIWGSGVDGGPWVMADLEDGLFAGWENGDWDNISSNTPLKHDFVAAILIGDTADKNENKGRFALYGGDATTGTVKTMYDGIRPEMPGYVPAKKQGSIILGTSGDTSSWAGGRFYEGVMANGVATKDTVDALQASVVAAEYGK